MTTKIATYEGIDWGKYWGECHVFVTEGGSILRFYPRPNGILQVEPYGDSVDQFIERLVGLFSQESNFIDRVVDIFGEEYQNPKIELEWYRKTKIIIDANSDAHEKYVTLEKERERISEEEDRRWLEYDLARQQKL